MISLYTIAAIYVLWIYYLAVMNLKRADDAGTIHPIARFLGYAFVLPPAVFLDWFLNMTLCTVLFADLPANKVELVTGRLKRYAVNPFTRRGKAAIWFTTSMLDVFDPSGKHL